jgi:peptidoglycan L-alanyl-D-glutamate endopeptidase CwlK
MEGRVNDAISNQRLAACHPALIAKVNAAANLLAMEGQYFRVAQALRTYAQQQALYEQGRETPGAIVTNAQAGYSNHNFGCAVDCYPFLSGTTGELSWDAESAQFQQMVRALKSQGLVWGGDWKSIKDPPHFQLAEVPVTPTDADRAAFASGGLEAVWAQYSVTA